MITRFTAKGMEHKHKKIDDFLLAGYLAGDLSPKDRSTVSDYLANDSSARELLKMAGEAMEAATTGEVAPPPETRKRSAGARNRPPYQTQSQTTLFRMIAMLAILIMTFGFALFLHVLDPADKDGAVDVPRVTVQWTPILGSEEFSVSWSAVESAAMYVVIIMDPNSERMISRIETTSTTIANLFTSPTHQGALSSDTVPRSGEILDLWISAFSERGQLLRRSDRIPFLAVP